MNVARVHPVEQALIHHAGETLLVHVMTCPEAGCCKPATELSRILCGRMVCALRGGVDHQHEKAGAA